MLYSIVLADACYEPSIEIPNPTKLEGWNDAMGVPYWVIAYAYNNREKWRPHRRDHCTVYGEGGFWTGFLEHTEFFIQDCDFATDPRFDEGVRKYRWERKLRKPKVIPDGRADPYRMVHYEGFAGGAGGGGGGLGLAGLIQQPQVEQRIFRWVENVEPAPQPAAVPAPNLDDLNVYMPDIQPVVRVRPPAGLRIRERLAEAAARVMNEPRNMQVRDEYGAALVAAEHPLPDEAAND